MSFDDHTGQIDWKDESVWIAISVSSGVLLWGIFALFERFAGFSQLLVLSVCCVFFYLLGILLRIQNKRGHALTGKPAFSERTLKWVFPFLGMGAGLVLLFT